MNIDRNAPVGVFDSGIGGLTVAREIMRNLPSEKIVYFGDTARVPYGSKSRETSASVRRPLPRRRLNTPFSFSLSPSNAMGRYSFRAAAASKIVSANSSNRGFSYCR